MVRLPIAFLRRPKSERSGGCPERGESSTRATRSVPCESIGAWHTFDAGSSSSVFRDEHTRSPRVVLQHMAAARPRKAVVREAAARQATGCNGPICRDPRLPWSPPSSSERTDLATPFLPTQAHSGRAHVPPPYGLVRRRLHPDRRDQRAAAPSRSRPHGCVRQRNGDIVTLAALMPLGTPVTIA
jgi:hypothetical protein